MGRIGDIADLVTGLALLGGGYLVYRAVKDVGDIIPEGPGWPEWPTFEWPTFEIPEIPGFIAPPYVPSPAPPEIPGDYLDIILRGGDVPPYTPNGNGTTSTGTDKRSSRRVKGSTGRLLLR